MSLVETDNKLLLDSPEKLNKKRSHVTKACVNCKKAHVSCDNARPCSRCQERGKSCTDGDSKKRGRKKRNMIGSPISPTTPMSPISPVTLVKSEGPLPSLSTMAMMPAIQNLPLSSSNNYILPIPDSADSAQLSDLPLDIFGEMFIFDGKETSATSDQTAIGPTVIVSKDDFFLKQKEYLLKRLPEVKFLFETWSQVRDKMKFRDVLSDEVIQTIKRDFDTYLNIFGMAFDQLGTPCIIWERCSVIRYVNQSFVDLTGFNNKIPTKVDEMAFSELLSSEGLKSYMSGMIHIHFNFGPQNTVDNFSFFTGIRIGNTDRFVYGTIWVTVKRDLIGVPMLLIGTFLPHTETKSGRKSQ